MSTRRSSAISGAAGSVCSETSSAISDTPELKKLLHGALYASDYKEAIVKNCIVLLTPPDRREKRVDMDEAVRCAAALGERRFILEVLPYAVGEAAVGAGEKKKRRWFGL